MGSKMNWKDYLQERTQNCKCEATATTFEATCRAIIEKYMKEKSPEALGLGDSTELRFREKDVQEKIKTLHTAALARVVQERKDAEAAKEKANRDKERKDAEATSSD